MFRTLFCSVNNYLVQYAIANKFFLQYGMENKAPMFGWIFWIGGWGGESAAAPTGKSFRFVRACVRARARRESQISYSYLEGFARRTFLLCRLRAAGFFTF